MADSWGQAGDAGAVLFLSYCLSHDQRWLLAAATDARGELRDTTAIDVHVPHRCVNLCIIGVDSFIMISIGC